MKQVKVNQLIVQLDNLGNIDLNKALNKAGVMVSNSAKRKVPVDTGQLRQSITHNVKGNTCEIGTNVEYAPYVEYGTGLFATNGDGRKDVPWRYQDAEGQWHTTSGMNPQPFLGPAFDENKQAIVDMFKEEIRKEIS